MFEIKGKFVDLDRSEIYPATVVVDNGVITDIRKEEVESDQYILPGFIDAHIHIESSMTTPRNFAAKAVTHGTVAAICDPHEIANVCGAAGAGYMVEDGRKSEFKFFFGASSCVPATTFENTGAVLDSTAVADMLASPDYWFLAEMMNFPGVVFGDSECLAKLDAARRAGKPIDGHAPGLSGEQLLKYVSQGITTDHECICLPEAEEKIAAGMMISVREGSAAKNFEALKVLLATHPDKVMFCCDDLHPDDLQKGHINTFVKRAIADGYNTFDVLRAASVNAVRHYNVPVGLLHKGDSADFILVDNLTDLNVLATYINGRCVAERGVSQLECTLAEPINNFVRNFITPSQLEVEVKGDRIKVIGATDGSLLTEELHEQARVVDGKVQTDVQRDILKLVVANRFKEGAAPAVAFIKGIGLKRGAIATSVAHDSHNVVAAGVSDEDIARAVNLVMENKGAMVVVDGDMEKVLPLPVAGLMSDKSVDEVGEAYAELTRAARSLGTPLKAPYMTMSFMSLLVIPSLKLSDLGLFDGNCFSFTGLEC